MSQPQPTTLQLVPVILNLNTYCYTNYNLVMGYHNAGKVVTFLPVLIR